MIKTYFEELVRKLEAEKERKINEVKDRVMREKIVPYNADIDNSRAKALTEIDNELNAKIAEIKTVYETKKQELVKLAEENKKANADTVLASELARVTVDLDAHIAKLNAQIAEIKE